MGLKAATKEFIEDPERPDDDEATTRRFVVFIDDLDRCLPERPCRYGFERQSFGEVGAAAGRARELQVAFPVQASSALTTLAPGSPEQAQQAGLLDAWLADVGSALSPLGQALTDLRRRTATGGTAAA